jgi:hypothetical protein
MAHPHRLVATLIYLCMMVRANTHRRVCRISCSTTRGLVQSVRPGGGGRACVQTDTCGTHCSSELCDLQALTLYVVFEVRINQS